jgi:transposase
MKAFSPDLRLKIVQAVDSGLPQQEVADRFAVGVATVERYLKRRRDTGHLEPRPLPGKPRRIGSEHHAALEALWRAHPDATLEELCRRWQEQTHQLVSPATMCRMHRRLNWTVKKNAPRQRAG